MTWKKNHIPPPQKSSHQYFTKRTQKHRDVFKRMIKMNKDSALMKLMLIFLLALPPVVNATVVHADRIFMFCNGEYKSTCKRYAPGAMFYKCKNPNKVAKSLCSTSKRSFEYHKSLVKDKSGNKCGYSVYRVICRGM